MNNYDPTKQDLEDLLRQVDSLLDEPEEEEWYGEEDWQEEEEEAEEEWFDEEPLDTFGDDDIDLYTPPEAMQDDSQMFYQNAANGYGSQVRNYRNNYGNPAPAPAPEPPKPRHDYRRTEDEYIEKVYNQPAIPAYNADFHQPKRERNTKSQAYKAQNKKQPKPKQKKPAPVSYEQELFGQEEPPVQKRPAQKPAKKRGCCGCGCGMLLVLFALMIALAVGIGMWAFDMPEAADSIGQRKKDSAAVLICGTDADGMRTDTMMLLYLSGSEDKMGLLSLPRDTYTIATAGYGAKLNSAYGRNNCGEEGMEALLDYIQDIIGYRPDGYVLVDMTTVPQIVDLMGGVEVDVPQAVETEGIYLDAGLQKLNGEQALSLLRHRSSYATADLGRVEVQRLVVEACIKQWAKPSHLGDAARALSLIETNSITNLSTRNYLWIGKTMLGCLSSGITTETLPGYADYIGDASYYILNRDEVADMINRSFNPYAVTIQADELNIAG